VEWKDRDVRRACFHPSRAWLGTHDFYPFVRATVPTYDPQMAKLR
jgi:hypothetical protein